MCLITQQFILIDETQSDGTNYSIIWNFVIFV